MSLTFQGGFVGTQCSIYASSDTQKDWWLVKSIYPEDVNRRQSFDLSSNTIQTGVGSLKLVFEQSSDFFGRVTLYDLKLEGEIDG